MKGTTDCIKRDDYDGIIERDSFPAKAWERFDEDLLPEHCAPVPADVCARIKTALSSSIIVKV